MKNTNFGALHNPLPSQSEMQERKPEEEIQQLAFSHACAKSSYALTLLDFYLKIFCVISYFLIVIKIDIFFYIFIYLVCVTFGTHRDVIKEDL